MPRNLSHHFRARGKQCVPTIFFLDSRGVEKVGQNVEIKKIKGKLCCVEGSEKVEGILSVRIHISAREQHFTTPGTPSSPLFMFKIKDQNCRRESMKLMIKKDKNKTKTTTKQNKQKKKKERKKMFICNVCLFVCFFFFCCCCYCYIFPEKV